MNLEHCIQVGVGEEGHGDPPALVPICVWRRYSMEVALQPVIRQVHQHVTCINAAPKLFSREAQLIKMLMSMTSWTVTQKQVQEHTKSKDQL